MSVITTEQELRQLIESVLSDQEYEITHRQSDLIVSTYHELKEELELKFKSYKFSKPVRIVGCGNINPQKLVYYFNDEKTPVTIVVGTLEGPRALVPPASGAWITVPANKNQAVYIKKWPSGLILISNSGSLPKEI